MHTRGEEAMEVEGTRGRGSAEHTEVVDCAYGAAQEFYFIYLLLLFFFLFFLYFQVFDSLNSNSNWIFFSRLSNCEFGSRKKEGFPIPSEEWGMCCGHHNKTLCKSTSVVENRFYFF